MKRVAGIFLMGLMTMSFSSCGVDTDKLDGWEVEVVLLKLGPIPTRDEIKEHHDILVGHHYKMISAVPLNRDGSSLMNDEMIIFQKLSVIDNLQVNGRGKLKVHRWGDRVDLRKRFTKRDFEIADDRPVFVVTDA